MSEYRRYISALRNPDKRTYAQAYSQYLLQGGEEPARPEGLSVMAAQAVRMTLTDCHRRSAESFACKPEATTCPSEDVYTVQPGRHIYRNGEAFIRIDLPGWPEKGANPTEGDAMAHVIAALLNDRQPKPGDRS